MDPYFSFFTLNLALDETYTQSPVIGIIVFLPVDSDRFKIDCCRQTKCQANMDAQLRVAATTTTGAMVPPTTTTGRTTYRLNLHSHTPRKPSPLNPAARKAAANITNKRTEERNGRQVELAGPRDGSRRARTVSPAQKILRRKAAKVLQTNTLRKQVEVYEAKALEGLSLKVRPSSCLARLTIKFPTLTPDSLHRQRTQARKAKAKNPRMAVSESASRSRLQPHNDNLARRKGASAGVPSGSSSLNDP